jgi:hypothetical protein
MRACLGYRLNLYLNALKAIKKTAKKLRKKEDLNTISVCS